MKINRRNFLRLGGAGLALGAAAPMMRLPHFNRSLQAAMLGTTPKKLLLMFMRGGWDGINVIIPHGDSAYSSASDSRPTLYIAPEDALDLGNSFASANPALAKVVSGIPQSNVAYVHRVGYDPSYFSRSHFDGQQYWENAYPGYPNLEEGWVNNLARHAPELADLTFPAASVSYNLQVAFRGPRALPNIPDLATYTIGDTTFDGKLLGVAPNNNNGSGLVGVYARKPDASNYDRLIRDNGLALAGSLAALSTAGVDESTYDPDGTATYPDASHMGDFPYDYGAFDYFRKLRHSVQILKETECRVAGIQLDGFDTHTDEQGQLDRLLKILAHGYRSVYRDTEDNIWNDLVIMTVSEFGRTSAENGSMGTDHAEALCMLIAGGGVSGGVYNCDSTTWDQGDMFSTGERYLAQKTDFRAVFAEIVDKHFGASDQLADIIPNWNTLYNNGSSFDYLNFLK